MCAEPPTDEHYHRSRDGAEEPAQDSHGKPKERNHRFACWELKGCQYVMEAVLLENRMQEKRDLACNIPCQSPKHDH